MNTEAKVGAMTIAGLLLLVYITILLGGGGLFSDTYRVEAVFAKVDGLKEGNMVQYAGVRVGSVKELIIKDDGVHVIMEIDEDKRLDQAASYRIGSDGLIGEKCVDILAPSLPSGSYAADGDVVRGEGAGGFDQMMSQSEQVMASVDKLLQSLQTVLGDPASQEAMKKSMQNLSAITANMDQMTRVMAQLAVDNERGLDQMLKNMTKTMDGMQKTVAQVEAMMTIIADDGRTAENIRVMMENMKITSDRVAHMAEAMEGVVTDPQTAADVKETLSHAKNLSARADSMLQKLDNIDMTVGMETLYDTDRKEFLGGADLKIRTSEDRFAVLGVTGIGIDTKTNAQIGLGTEDFAGRFGMTEDKFGLGLDKELGSRAKLFLDLYDPGDVRVKLRAQYEFAPSLYLVGQGNSLNKSEDRSAYFGLRKTF